MRRAWLFGRSAAILNTRRGNLASEPRRTQPPYRRGGADEVTQFAGSQGRSTRHILFSRAGDTWSGYTNSLTLNCHRITLRAWRSARNSPFRRPLLSGQQAPEYTISLTWPSMVQGPQATDSRKSRNENSGNGAGIESTQRRLNTEVGFNLRVPRKPVGEPSRRAESGTGGPERTQPEQT